MATAAAEVSAVVGQVVSWLQTANESLGPEALVPRDSPHSRAYEAGQQAGVLRCLFGNPWQPPLVAPLRNETVLAQAAYDDRRLPLGMLDLDRLGVLADALEEVGGTDARLLEHLRSPGPHVRGCFALDAVLGKS